MAKAKTEMSVLLIAGALAISAFLWFSLPQGNRNIIPSPERHSSQPTVPPPHQVQAATTIKSWNTFPQSQTKDLPAKLLAAIKQCKASDDPNTRIYAEALELAW